MLENAKLYDKDFDSSATRSWGATTVINGTTYATGLFWQPLQNRDDPYGEIEESAESVQEGADLFALKQGKSVQFGVCASSDGYKKGTPSLAVSVATGLSDKSSFVAVFKVDNGWWYCCVRNDILLSDGDALFLKEEDAKDQFMSMLAVPDWGRKIAPKEWGLPETEVVDIGSIIANGARAKLQKIKALRGPKLYAIVAVSAVVSFWLVSSFITDILFAPRKAPVIVAPVQPKMIKPIEEEKIIIILPWEVIKNPEIVLNYCYRDVMALRQILPPGWKIGGITCDDRGVTTSWRREVGRIAWVDKALSNSGISFLSKSISGDGNTVIASTYYKVPIIKSPPMYGETELRNIINDLFQTLDIPVSLGIKEVEAKEKGRKNQFIGRKEEAKKYKALTFSFSSPQNPLTWKDILTKFSGLMFDNIRYDNDSGIWYYEGAIYVL